MYCVTNFKTKKALKEALKAGDEIETFQLGGLFPATKNGPASLEGPHYPQPHTWYAECELKDGFVVKGSVK